MARDNAHDALLDRVDKSLAGSQSAALGGVRDVIAQARRDAQEIIAFLAKAPDDIRQLHARRVTAWLSDLTQASLLLEAAENELKTSGSARKAAVARFFVRERLASSGGPMHAITEDRSVLDLFEAITRYQPLAPEALPAGA